MLKHSLIRHVRATRRSINITPPQPPFHTINTNHTRTMSSHLQAQPLRSSPLTRLAVTALQNLYPESLADGSFDNTGLLLEAPDLSSSSGGKKRSKVLLTIDLTTAVADEAVARGAGVVVAYRKSFSHLWYVTLEELSIHCDSCLHSGICA